MIEDACSISQTSRIKAQNRRYVRTILRGLIERGQSAGELRADLTPEDLILATSLLSRPLPGLAPSLVSRSPKRTDNRDKLACRQIDLMIEGLGPI